MCDLPRPRNSPEEKPAGQGDGQPIFVCGSQFLFRRLARHGLGLRRPAISSLTIFSGFEAMPPGEVEATLSAKATKHVPCGAIIEDSPEALLRARHN